MNNLHNIMNCIDENKDKLNDADYKTICDELKILAKTNKKNKLITIVYPKIKNHKDDDSKKYAVLEEVSIVITNDGYDNCDGQCGRMNCCFCIICKGGVVEYQRVQNVEHEDFINRSFWEEINHNNDSEVVVVKVIDL